MRKILATGAATAVALVLASPTLAQQTGGSSPQGGEPTRQELQQQFEQRLENERQAQAQQPQGPLPAEQRQQPPAGTAGQAASTETDQVFRSVEADAADFTTVLQAEVTADQLLDMDVMTRNGEELGDVEDVIVEGRTVRAIIVEVGGFLGMGQRAISLDIGSAQLSADDDDLVVDMTREQVEQMPTYERVEGGWRRQTESN